MDGRERLQGRYCFLRFLRPPGERKNPDWSELIKYSIDCSNWSVICHSTTLASCQLHSTRQMNWEAIVFSVFKKPLHSLEENGFNYEMKVEQRKAIGQLSERKDLLAVRPTSLIFNCACWLLRSISAAYSSPGRSAGSFPEQRLVIEPSWLREEPKLEILHGTWH